MAEQGVTPLTLEEKRRVTVELEQQIRRYLITGKKEAPKVTRTSPNVVTEQRKI